MLSGIPDSILIPILAIAGLLIGVFVNWAIYAWALTQDRRISPWQKPESDASPRDLFDKIPIFGWWGRQGESKTFGSGFWIRPMLLELVFMFGVPAFYFWQINGGLSGGVSPSPLVGETWFYGHTILLVLMCIGTFIDFDEKMIPDEITIPGTLIALLFAAFAPWFRLPEIGGGFTAMVTKSIEYDSPNNLGTLHLGTTGLFLAMAIYAIWIWALIPKLPVWPPCLSRLILMLRFSFAHAWQPKRKTKCEFRTVNRETPTVTKMLAALFVVGMIAIFVAKQTLSPVNWESLFGAFVGLAFAGGMIWLIRILGTVALQTEAMGFGDVTLWGMVGAFLGWHATLVGFFFAPFAALGVSGYFYVTKKQNELPFGPYLCFGAAVTLFWWHPIWSKTSEGVFKLGPILWYILGGSLVLMVIMLTTLAWFKGDFGPEEDYDETDN